MTMKINTPQTIYNHSFKKSFVKKYSEQPIIKEEKQNSLHQNQES